MWKLNNNTFLSEGLRKKLQEREYSYIQKNGLVEWLMVEHLLSKCEALSLNPSTTKNT
jgi:hypothetical protein